MILGLWLNKIGLGSLSKVVQQLQNHSNMSLYQDRLNIFESMNIFVRNYCATRGVVFLFYRVILPPLLNEASLWRLNKVILQV